MAILKNSVGQTVKEYLIITLGIFLYVIGWVTFITPNNLVGGGVTGLGSIIQYATNGFIPMGVSYGVLNTVLLVAAFLILGKSMGAKTIYAIVLATIGLSIVPNYLPQSIVYDLAISNGKLMATIMGGICAGTGIGISISQGGSTGGTDIVALIYTKFHNVSPGRIILFIDVFVILSSLLVPSFAHQIDPETGKIILDAAGNPVSIKLPFAEKVTTVVYGLILVTVNSYVVDVYLSGTKQSVQFFILSKKSKEIADAISTDLNRGVTVLNGKGWYSKNDIDVLMVITRKTDMNIFLRYIKTIDPDAFVSVSSVYGVYGKGFEAIKG